MTAVLGGLDIGGTKCAAVIGTETDGGIEIADKIAFPTPSGPEAAITRLCRELEELLARHGHPPLAAVGISCGGPLDSRSGLVLSPPNLPGWDRFNVVAPVRERFGVPVGLQNDANACALAEWKWGAGRGTQNMIFLTFGTGMGAGLILNGRLYAGANDMAGEVGHMRLAEDGPEGYGKAGSFEGFCSGGGIARLAAAMTVEWLAAGKRTLLAADRGAAAGITAKAVGEAAQAGDELALAVMRTVGRQLGRGLAVLVDVLNPERIVIGSIYARQRELLEPVVMEELRREALAVSLQACEIVPAGLGEQVGDAASLSVARLALEGRQKERTGGADSG
ncbi:ROK family transcriptional regulator [Paenibacillus sp. 32O-W]|uniref:ROK family protein n=1 Tax=Paenibacillus sp. 32O-W TaxID=1695218 RepID=UPI0007218CF9|nr:ROK family protein [Paenibacillus sp. 32O-W]ALS27095.1 ROK family transcriptional regulator [Paenibacillus sp. 32O-W]